jgi:alcohol dehydrogenase (NADP+)
MTDKIKAWACLEKGGQIQPWEYEPRQLGADDVEIKITHCGMCGSDLHHIDSGWRPGIYPMVPGHEIVGHVIAKGSNVKDFELGQRVGVGAQAMSCLECDECHNHLESYCEGMVTTYDSKYPDGAVAYGGYATRVRVHQHFTFAIPENLPSEGVAPLFCAGITVLSPMLKHGVKEGTKLGVIGIGGLGHMGIQWGRALGATTVAISHSKSKEQEAYELGATDFIYNEEQKKKHRRSFDFIVCTVNYDNIDLSQYLSLLKVDGQFIMVGAPETPIQLSVFSLIKSRISVSGSAIGSPEEIRYMLKLASEKNVIAKTQLFAMHEVNEAIKQFREGKPHFRFVLEIKE